MQAGRLQFGYAQALRDPVRREAGQGDPQSRAATADRSGFGPWKAVRGMGPCYRAQPNSSVTCLAIRTTTTARKSLADEARRVLERQMVPSRTLRGCRRPRPDRPARDRPVAGEEGDGERLVAKLITLALAEPWTKSIPNSRTKPKIRKLPVPGPKKPS